MPTSTIPWINLIAYLYDSMNKSDCVPQRFPELIWLRTSTIPWINVIAYLYGSLNKPGHKHDNRAVLHEESQNQETNPAEQDWSA